MRHGVRARIGVALGAVLVVIGGVLLPVAAAAPARAADLSQFDPGNIISDSVFFYTGSMSQAQIQSFLEGKETSCAPSATCVKNYYTVTKSVAADPMCGAYPGGYSERASAIIYKVAQACGINPQVLLVTMQKEQGLITSVWPSDWAYAHAMGADCPDTTGCNSISAGFFAQVYKSAWQLKRYANPSGTSNYFTWYAPGHTWNILYNPNTACGTKAVYVKNQATADLYYYTPYTPNAAALAAGYGTGDSCSAYGNRNFYNYFVDWFGSTQIPANACTPPTAAQITPGSGEFLVNVASLNGRIAPSTSCPTGIVSLPQGTILTRLGTWDTWTQVRLNGQIMWVASQYLVAAPPVSYTTARIAGADRYSTAAAIAQQSNPNGATTVYLASGESFPDALSGASLAALKSAPMLLTAAGTLPQPTAAALAALHPASVVVLGGETAVSQAVFNAVGAIVGQTNVSRVSGADRYATSLAIVDSGWKTAPVAYLATGSGFADALAASAVAGAAGAPVLLTDGAQTSLGPALATALQTLHIGKVIIAGGSQAISDGIASQLSSLGITVDRRAGSDRYQTSVLLAADAPSASQSFISSGTNFPDALAGAVMAGRLKSPLLTTPATCMADVTKDFLISRGATTATLFGGPDALDADVLSSVRC